MQIKMDTDAVRSLSSSVKNFATSYENRIRAIKQSAESTNWQSQAREEFIQDLNLVVKGGTYSVEALRLMSRAANRKVDQWEAIGNVFNGPFYFLEGIWDSFRNYLGNSWNNLLKTMGSIRWPSATAITGIGLGIGSIGGWFDGIKPSWPLPKLPWLHRKQEENNNPPPIPKGNTPTVIDEPVFPIDYSNIAKEVKIGVRGTYEFGYPRNGYGGVQSNCTWFAAQAVSEASGGDVSLSEWGPATKWLDNAQNYLSQNPDGYIKSIDRSPAIGDVMQLDIGHVAFVENVEITNGKTYITWVEENATGVCDWGNNEQIKVDGNPILRWRVTRELDAMTGYDPHFIHINY